MPNNILQKSDDNEGYQWLHIDDFTAGLYDFDATNQSSTVDNVPAPLGSCSVNGTSGCIGLPNGGLAPLPWLAATPASWPYTVDTPVFLVGIETNTARVFDYLETGQTYSTELIIIAESDNGIAHVFAVNSYIVETATTNAVLFSSSATTGKFWGSPYPQWTLLSSEAATDHPVLVFPSIVPTDSQGLNGHMYNYTSLAATVSYGTDDMVAASTGGGKTGQLICYDGRVLGITTPNWEIPPSSSYTLAANEFIEYTDPPGQNTYEPTGNEVAILVPENPFGYGVAGSISAGELFLVKKRGGGVLVLGDIDAPSSVTYLPGVRPTGNFFGRGESSIAGFVYCSQGAGAWVWNGSNVSQKISNQLDDNFFDCTTETGMNSTNYGFFVKKWGGAGGLLLFSNSFVYSETTQSWWRLTEGPFYHYTDATDQHQIYALPLMISDADQQFLFTYDTRVPAPYFYWISNDIFKYMTKSNDRVVDIREIMLVASNRASENQGAIEVQIISNNSIVWSGTAEMPTGPNAQPITFRLNAGVFGIDNLQLVITSQSNNITAGESVPASTVWSIDIAFRTRAKQASDN